MKISAVIDIITWGWRGINMTIWTVFLKIGVNITIGGGLTFQRGCCKRRRRGWVHLLTAYLARSQR